MNEDLKEWIKLNLFDTKNKISPKKLFKYPDKKEEINKLTSFLQDSASLSQRCWHILNDNFNIIKCCICKEKEVKYVNLQVGYHPHCSQKCSMRNPKVTEKYNNSMIDKYGVPWPMQSKALVNKSQETCVTKYGVTSFTKTDQFKIQMSEKYQNETIEKREIRLDKNRKTNIEKYGVDWFSKTELFGEKCKRVWFENYGVEHPSQSSIVAEKTLGGYKKSWHEYTLPSGKIIKLQGYEPQVFDELLKIYNENEILYKKGSVPQIWYIDKNNKRHRYFPDFYIPKDNLIIEVKSTFTYNKELEKNLLKEKSAREGGYNFRMWIWK